jgi:hypothetical protein
MKGENEAKPEQPEKGLKFVISGDSLLPTAPYADLHRHIGVWDQYVDEIELNSLSYANRLEAFPDGHLMKSWRFEGHVALV